MSAPEIPGYKILEKIADGGMATVYKARQLSLDRSVALKVLNTGVIQREQDIERFRVEARSAAKLRHPGLCEIYDAGDVDGMVYYAMEYIAGFSVGQLIARKGDIPEKQALMIIYGAAQVLGALWKKYQVVHCDIKPHNILIDTDGSIRITDLGVSRILGRMSHLDSDYFVGTPNYMSPEQARGADDLDARTDVYALGATLYHLLTGIMPFAEAEGEAAMDLQLEGYLADPQAINPLVSDEAAVLVERMMIKDRHARYPDWDTVLADIQAVRSGRLPAGELPAPGLSTVGRSEQREQAVMARLRAARPAHVGPADEGSADDTVADVPVARLPAKGRSKGRSKASESEGAKRSRLKVAAPLNPKPIVRCSESGGRAFFKMLHVAAWTALLYGATFWFLTRPDSDPEEAASESAAPTRVAQAPTPDFIRPATRAPQESPSAPERRAEPAPTARSAPAPRPAETASPPPTRPASTEEAPDDPSTWSHPDYTQAIRLLQRADRNFQRFLEERDQALLEDIEPNCRRAIELLEGLRNEAPVQARVGERIRQAYQMIHNSRQARVMAR